MRKAWIIGVAGLGLLVSCFSDEPECGDPGTHSHPTGDGECVCDAGHVWSGDSSTVCVCRPACGTRECGVDPVCGRSCGTCWAPDSCDTDAGTCTGDCVPDCGGRECGRDPVCGSICGSCEGGTICGPEGTCGDTPCVPDCANRQCGLDPVCGESCGTCDTGTCNESGQCEGGPCVPDCAGRECGPDPVCGQSCGTCANGTCTAAGQCEDEPCVPDCGGRECGADPVCGESCGSCTGVGEICDDGDCVLGECPGGTLECDGQCVDYFIDVNNCGYCDEKCPTWPGGLTECIAATCYLKCPGMEGDRVNIDFLTDEENCGSCGHVCPDSTVSGFYPKCVEGECNEPCEAGESVCGTYCADLKNDPENCGYCGHRCEGADGIYGGHAVCQNGVCRAPVCDDSDETVCDNSCKDLDSNTDHCGSCDYDCWDVVTASGTEMSSACRDFCFDGACLVPIQSDLSGPASCNTVCNRFGLRCVEDQLYFYSCAGFYNYTSGEPGVGPETGVGCGAYDRTSYYWYSHYAVAGSCNDVLPDEIPSQINGVYLDFDFFEQWCWCRE